MQKTLTSVDGLGTPPVRKVPACTPLSAIVRAAASIVNAPAFACWHAVKSPSSAQSASEAHEQSGLFPLHGTVLKPPAGFRQRPQKTWRSRWPCSLRCRR